MPLILIEAVESLDFKTSKDYIKKACIKNKTKQKKPNTIRALPQKINKNKTPIIMSYLPNKQYVLFQVLHMIAFMFLFSQT